MAAGWALRSFKEEQLDWMVTGASASAALVSGTGSGSSTTTTVVEQTGSVASGVVCPSGGGPVSAGGVAMGMGASEKVLRKRWGRLLGGQPRREMPKRKARDGSAIGEEIKSIMNRITKIRQQLLITLLKYSSNYFQPAEDVISIKTIPKLTLQIHILEVPVPHITPLYGSICHHLLPRFILQ